MSTNHSGSAAGSDDERDKNRSRSSANAVADTSTGEENIVTNVGPNDVLMGRGAPSTEYEGNMRFRLLVMERRAEYTSADRRKDKQRIAREIIQTVRNRGGKFLQRVSNNSGSNSLVRPREGIAWKLVHDLPALCVKVKQLMRDVGTDATERRNMRRQRKRLQVDDKKMNVEQPSPSMRLFSHTVSPQPQPQQQPPPQPLQQQHEARLLQQLRDLLQRQCLSQYLLHEQRQRYQNPIMLLNAVLQRPAQDAGLTAPVDSTQPLLQLFREAQRPQSHLPQQATSFSSSLLFSLVNQQTDHSPASSPPVDPNIAAIIDLLARQTVAAQASSNTNNTNNPYHGNFGT